MQIEEILNYCFPFTDEDLRCAYKKQQKTYRREKLRLMVDRYKHGDLVNFDGLHISVDVEELLKRINN